MEDAIETSIPVALTTQFGVDIAFTTQDLKLSIDDFRERFLEPAYATVANKIDYDGMQLLQAGIQRSGYAGNGSKLLIDLLERWRGLDNQAAPRGS